VAGGGARKISHGKLDESKGKRVKGEKTLLAIIYESLRAETSRRKEEDPSKSRRRDNVKNYGLNLRR